MQGHCLSYIIGQSIDDYDKEKREVKVDYNMWEPFDGSQKHKNIIIADTLEAIEDVLLFRFSNYFLRFNIKSNTLMSRLPMIGMSSLNNVLTNWLNGTPKKSSTTYRKLFIEKGEN